MTTRPELRQLTDAIRNFDPAADDGAALTFDEIARRFPFAKDPKVPAVRMADFAEFGYCPYKAWNRVRGVEEVRTIASQKALAKGTQVHEAREAKVLEVAAALPKATKKHLANPKISLAELPEVPGRIQVGGIVYASRADGVERRDGDLVVREVKTSRRALMADHLLQVWGYCASAPGFLRMLEPTFAANEVHWTLEYPGIPRTEGPFPFTNRCLDLLQHSMAYFEEAHASTHNGTTLAWTMPVVFPKCKPCSFVQSCPWAAPGSASAAAAQSKA